MATLFLLLIYLTFISLGLPDSLLGAAWPVMRLDLVAPLDAAGIVTMIISGGTILSSLLSERVIRRFGTGVVTAVSVAATALALLGFSTAPALGWLVALAVPLGLGAGAVDSALNNYVALHYKAHHMSWLHCFWGVGAFAGPMILAAFIQGGNWRGGYLTVALIQCGVAALLFLTLPLWKRMNQSTPIQTDAKSQEVPAAGSAFKIPGVVFALLTFLLYCATEYCVGLWGSSYLVEMRGLGVPAAARGTALFYLGITVGRFVSGFLTAVLSSKQLIRTGILLVMGGGLLLVLPLPTAFALGGLALTGLGCAPIYPSMIHETPRRFGAANSQKVIGLQMAFAYCGSTFLPPVVGFVSNWAGIRILPGFLLAFAVGMLLATEAINRMMARRAAR